MKTVKQIASLLIVLAMVLSFAPQVTLAAEEAYTGNRPAVLIVGGVSVDVSRDASGDTWDYDFETNTLTVTGNILVTATENATDSGIYVDKDLNVVFSGTEEEIHVDGTYGIYSESGNLHITTTEGTEAYCWTSNAAAIQTSGDVVIDGSGELNAISHINQQGIRANNLTIREVTQLYVDEITVTQSMTLENAFLWCISGATVGGALTIENSHVRMNSRQAAFDSENCSAANSVVFNGNSIYVAGNAALRANEEFGQRDTVTYGYGATLDSGDYNFSVNADAVIYTTAEDGTVTQHIHNTDGGIDYEDYDNSQYHFTTKICAGCPAGYVYGNAEEHEFGADGLCVYCGAAIRYDLIIDGVMVNVHNADDILGDGTVSYDTGTNTLTLNNANITDGMYANEDMAAGIGIMASDSLTIELVGENFVSAASSDTISCGIFCQGALTFSGSGKLTVGCGTGEQMSGALFAAVMTVGEETTITAENVVIAMELTNNGTLNALVGDSIPTNNYEVYGNVTLTEDLEVTRETDPDSGCGSIIIMEGAVLTISDGVTLTIGRTDKEDSIINNGKVILEGTGTIVNNGTGSCSETAAHCYVESQCVICGTDCPHNFASDSICTLCGCREVYFDNSSINWSEVNAYFWNGNSPSIHLTAWPGEAMEKVNGSHYHLMIPGEATMIIFNNGLAQTGDLALGDQNCYKLSGFNGTGFWYDYPCEHSWENGTCSLCKIACEHSYEGGVCTLCGMACNHSYENGFCIACDAYQIATLNESGVYEISNAGQLYWFAALVNGTLTDGTAQNKAANAILTADITVNENVLVNGELASDTTGFRPWISIGNFNVRYTGSFDGKGFTISGLYLNDSTAEYAGLFGWLHTGAEVKAVHVTDTYIRGNSGIGGITGTMRDAAISGCSFSGVLQGEDDHVGGIAGSNGGGTNGGGTITDCTSSGTVTSTSYYAGGIVGSNYKTVQNCHSSCSVAGENYIGGIVGSNGSSGTIENCYYTGSTTATASSSNVGGITANNSGTIRNCYNAGSVAGTGGSPEAGGIVGRNYGSVESSYSIGTINGIGDRVGGVVGLGISGSSVTSCYYDSDVYTGAALGGGNSTTTDTEGKTTAQFASGEVAYLLQKDQAEQVWGQNIDNGEEKQDYPVFSNAIVNYGYTSCAEAAQAGYTNNKNALAEKPAHTFNGNGFCTACDGYEPAVDSDEDGYYEISNAGQLYWFADYINNEYNSAYAKLMNDIEVPASAPNWVPIGGYYVYSPYCGAFDGQGHTISGLKCVSEGKYVGLFGLTGYNYEIKNIGILNGYFEGTDYVGGLIGSAESYVSNCYVVNTTIKSDGNYVGGLVGYNSSSIENCYVDTSGLVGYSVSSYGATVTNSYYLSDTDDGNGGKTAEQFESGEVAYLLQSGIVAEEIYDEDLQDWVTGEVPHVWGQSIGADSYPVLGGAKVYRVTGTPCTAAYGYANAEDAVMNVPHNFTDNGFCKNCDTYEPAVLNSEDVYEIGNAGQLYWFAALVNGTLTDGTAQNKAAKAILTANITVNENVLVNGELASDTTGFRPWASIGNRNARYTGSFDGKDFTVSGLYLNDSTVDCVGLFGWIDGTVEVKNIHVVDSYLHGNQWVGGIAGIMYAGTISGCSFSGVLLGDDYYVGGIAGSNGAGTDSGGIITDCSSSGTVTSTNYYAGGIAGNNYKTVQNCHSSCTVLSKDYAGGIVGSNGSSGTVENCYFIGYTDATTVAGVFFHAGGVAGINSGTIRNCYNTGSVTGTGSSSEAGGIVGRNYGLVERSYSIGTVTGSGSRVGGVCGYSVDGTLTSCYYNSDVYTGTALGDGNSTTTDTEGKTTAQFASGEVAYLLQKDHTEQVWGQNVDNGKTNEGHPVFSDAKVYYGYASCEDSVVAGYTNSSAVYEEKPAHSYENGICTGCSVFASAVAVTEENYEALNLTSEYVGYYAISNAGQLYWFARLVNTGYGDVEQNRSAKAVLTADIDMEGRAWYPIGVYQDPAQEGGEEVTAQFAGSFDGKGHTVSNFTATGNGSQGLVGYTSGSVIVRNVGVIGAAVSGWNAGAVLAFQGTVENCFAIGCTVTGSSQKDSGSVYPGAVAGSQSPTVKNCHAVNCVINAGENETNVVAGGVGGKNITNSYYTGCTGTAALREVSGETAVTGEAFSSGEVAYLLGADWGQTIGTDLYPVPGGAKVYRVIGAPCTASYGYANAEDAVVDIPHDFTDNNGVCKRCDAYEPAVQNADGYYEIGNAGQLYWFAALVNGDTTAVPGIKQNGAANAILTADITVNSNVLGANGELNEGEYRVWTPIANSSDKKYTGTFNGGSKTISGLYFNDSAASYVGLFGYVSGTVQNVGVADSYLYGKYSVGGIVGYVYNGTVTNCYNAGAVSCSDSPVGGVVGYNYGKITDCYNTGYVSGRYNYVGGVVGQNKSSTVTNCYNSGTVTGMSGHVGGVVGQNDTGTVTNCYNTGVVSGSNYDVGGVVGYNPYGTVANCYNAGVVSGQLDVGGVVGASANGNCSVTNCYNTGTVSGSRNYVGGVLGHMYSGTFANCYNTGTVSGGGDYVGGVVSYINGGTITNCYYLGTEETDSIDGTTYKTTEQFASGEVCWLLNGSSVEGVWGQKLETHVLPILGEPKVCYKEGFGYYNMQGWTEQNGFWYYYDPETGKAVTGISRVPYPAEAIDGVTYAPNPEDLAGDPSYGYTDGETALFVFDEKGVFQNELNGLYEGHWAVNGQLPWHVGLVQEGEDYYYFLGENVMVTGNTYMARNTTDLDVVIGGIYTFGADGKMYLYDGVGEVNGTLYYYEDYRLVMGVGLVKLDGNYYYVRSNGAVVVDQRYWVANVNEYTEITPGFYVFDENGVMQIPEPVKDGIYEEDGTLYYYENGHRVGKGLIRYTDGENYNNDWIYVRSNGQLATGRYWATNVGSSGMAQGMYSFDELGRMEPAKDGIVEEFGRLCYYAAGIKQYGAGLIKMEDGSYIYVRSNGELAIGRYWVTNTNGLMDEGFQLFGKDGKMLGV